MFGIGCTGTQGMFGGRTELTEVLGTGIEFAPNLTEMFGGALQLYRTLPIKFGRYSYVS